MKRNYDWPGAMAPGFFVLEGIGMCICNGTAMAQNSGKFIA